jgi:hypothetical protein
MRRKEQAGLCSVPVASVKEHEIFLLNIHPVIEQ